MAWIDCLLTTKDGQIIVCDIQEDGLLLRINRGDINHLLVDRHKDSTGWFFNESKDRYIAERTSDNKVLVNPQLIWQAGYDIHT